MSRSARTSRVGLVVDRRSPLGGRLLAGRAHRGLRAPGRHGRDAAARLPAALSRSLRAMAEPAQVPLWIDLAAVAFGAMQGGVFGAARARRAQRLRHPRRGRLRARARARRRGGPRRAARPGAGGPARRHLPRRGRRWPGFAGHAPRRGRPAACAARSTRSTPPSSGSSSSSARSRRRTPGCRGGAIILLGAITGVGGGVMRDLLAQRPVLLVQRSTPYALVALLGAAAFVALDTVGRASRGRGRRLPGRRLRGPDARARPRLALARALRRRAPAGLTHLSRGLICRDPGGALRRGAPRDIHGEGRAGSAADERRGHVKRRFVARAALAATGVLAVAAGTRCRAPDATSGPPATAGSTPASACTGTRTAPRAPWPAAHPCRPQQYGLKLVGKSDLGGKLAGAGRVADVSAKGNYAYLTMFYEPHLRPRRRADRRHRQPGEARR